MNVLGFDTATAATAVALRLADGTSYERRDDPEPGAHPGHATRLLAMADELLVESGIGWSAVERIAVGLGPGTFTGLRVGVATARGLAQSLSAELVGVGSLAALALPALARHPTVLAVIDARRGEVFAAAYRTLTAAGPHELSEPRALAPGEVGSRLAGAADTGAEWWAVGDGALRYRDEIERSGVIVPPDASPLHRVGAGAICALGSERAPSARLLEVEPDYRRRPDAELAFQDAGADAARRG